MAHDIYAGSSETTEGRVFTVTGQDWSSITEGLADAGDGVDRALGSDAFFGRGGHE